VLDHVQREASLAGLVKGRDERTRKYDPAGGEEKQAACMRRVSPPAKTHEADTIDQQHGGERDREPRIQRPARRAGFDRMRAAMRPGSRGQRGQQHRQDQAWHCGMISDEAVWNRIASRKIAAASALVPAMNRRAPA
jgi:hypothetical protein